MTIRERRHQQTPRDPSQIHPDLSPSGTTTPLLSLADRLLAAGEHAIARGLSGNSEAFLQNARQQGGE
jgi:hypothetical protein